MRIKQYIILMLLAFASLHTFATHIVGGEIYYDNLGSNNYRITLKLYRDCSNPLNALYDNPATIFIFNSSGTLVDSIEIPFPGSVILPTPLSNPCLVPPSNICVEQAIYQKVVTLPPLAGGYDITYQRCCRNVTILNLTNPGAVGATYMAHIPDPGLAVINSSPRYNNFPPIFLCAGVPLNFDHAATDPDGDSLYYDLCDAYTGLDQFCPIVGPQTPTGCNALAPSPPAPFVPWASPYSGSYPMSSSPALAVNPVTGLMTGTPNMIGQWVIAVCVKEYRHGVLLDVNKRDFQFNVVNCGIPVASIPSQQSFCFGSPSHFTQNSINAFSYHWDFGDPGTSLDTSNVLSPTWTYAAAGTYTVSLIVNPRTLCADTATLVVTINSPPSMTSANSATICGGTAVSIPLTASIPSTFAWVAADNPNTTGESITTQAGTPLSNAIANVTTSTQSVIYTVTPTSVTGTCVGASQTVTVSVKPSPTMTSPNSGIICTGGTVSIPLTSNIASTFSWIAADNLNTTGESTTTQTGSPLSNTITNNSASIQTVTYTVTATSSAGSCLGIPQTLSVTVNPAITMTSATTTTICSGGTVSIPLTGNISSTFAWVAADNLNTTGESTTSQTGSPLSNTITNNSVIQQTVSYNVTPTSVSGSCLGTSQAVTVKVNPAPTMTSVTGATICSGGAVSIPLTSNLASTFSWIAANNPNTTGESITSQTGSPLSNTITNTTTSLQTVVYTVTPTSTANSCAGTPQTVSVNVNPSPIMTSASSATICNGGTLSIPLTGSSASTFSWIAANNPNTTGESITTQTGSPLSNTITNNTTALQTVTYTVTPTATTGSCLGVPQTVLVNVNPSVTMTSSNSATICTGGTVSIPLTSNVSSNFSWVAANNANTSGESISPQTANPLSNTITSISASQQTITYTVTPTSSAGNCVGAPQTVIVKVNPLPTVTSSNSATVCNGVAVNLPLTGSPASTFSWIATDNPNTTGESTTPQNGNPLNDIITDTTTSLQTVTYMVTPTSTAGSCVGTPQTVTITVSPSPTMTNPNGATICSGTTVNIPLTSNFASPYTWVAADNPNTTGESTVLQNGSPLNNTITNTSTSLQSVIYTVTPTSSGFGCAGIPQTLTVSVIPPPTITNPLLASICTDGIVSIPLTSSVTSTYSWIATDNLNTTGESTTTQTSNPLCDTITNNSTSVQTITYSVTPTSSADGCVGIPQNITVSVYNGITADFDFVKVPCTNQFTFYDSSAVAPVSWLWHFADGDSSSVQNPQHTFDTTGVYNVQLIVATAHGCKDTVVVQVNLTPASPITVSSSITICKGSSTQLNATGGFAYSWTPVTGLNNPIIPDPIANPDTTTLYNVTISTVGTLGDTCIRTLSTTVHILDPSLYSIFATADSDTIIQGHSTTVHAITDTTLTVTWRPSTGVSNVHSFNPTVTPDTTTTYTVSILDSVGCPKIALVTIYVMSEKCNVSDVFVPNAFTPNGDGQNDILYVRGREIKQIYFAIYNRFGELVFETTDITKGWNGMYKGMKADPAVFAWYLTAKCFNGDGVEKKGNVTLIR
jgi:gliding motility-associated-like protein